MKYLILFTIVAFYNILNSYSCYKTYEKSSKCTKQNVFIYQKENLLNKKNTLKCELLDNNKDFSIAHIVLIEDNKLIEIYDTLAEKYNDLSSFQINDSIADIYFEPRIGRYDKRRKYQFNINSAKFINILETQYTGEEEWYCFSVFSMRLEDFSDKYFEEYFINDSEFQNKICFSIPADWNEGKNPPYPDLSKFELYVKNLFNEHNNKISLCADTVLLKILGYHIISPEKENIVSLNNIAYYFEQSGAYEGAIYILENLVNKFPSRTLAYLNLGDAYWGAKRTGDAKKAYKTYIEQMHTQGKGGKIPGYVIKRVE